MLALTTRTETFLRLGKFGGSSSRKAKFFDSSCSMKPSVSLHKTHLFIRGNHLGPSVALMALARCLTQRSNESASMRQTARLRRMAVAQERPPGKIRRSSSATPMPASVRTGLYGQVNKRIRWMPWQLKAMKDVAACDKPRGVGNRL